jgi:hypothetical protein
MATTAVAGLLDGFTAVPSSPPASTCSSSRSSSPPPPPVPSSAFTSAPASYPLRPGNRLSFYYTRPAFFHRLELVLDDCGANEDVLAAVSFVDFDFALPSRRRWWEALNACAARGANVCVLLWSPLRPEKWGSVLPATRHEVLEYAKTWWKFRVAWDVSPWASHCHHQKYFYTSKHGAFVGGMVLTGSSTRVELNGAGHDTFLELHQGSPVQQDVRANFVARWNDSLTRGSGAGGGGGVAGARAGAGAGAGGAGAGGAGDAAAPAGPSAAAVFSRGPLPVAAGGETSETSSSEAAPKGATAAVTAAPAVVVGDSYRGDGVLALPTVEGVLAQLLFTCPGYGTYAFRPNGERSVSDVRLHLDRW